MLKLSGALTLGLIALFLWSSHVAADPPPWAPAHGYRAKQKHKFKKGHDEVYVVPFGISTGTCHRELIGSVLGGATGAVVGSQIGKGSGRTAAVVGGTILGVIVGGAIGRSMDQVDQNCVGQILEHAPDRQRVVWTNDDDGAQYVVTPQRTYQTAGRYCREYTTQAVIGGSRQEVYGTACRQPDGSWQIVN